MGMENGIALSSGVMSKAKDPLTAEIIGAAIEVHPR